MRLYQTQVENYRSIVDSGIAPIEENCTVLIGKNEQGKTNFLRALSSFNEDKKYKPGDLPNHLRPTLEEGEPSKIKIITLWLYPNNEEKKKLLQIVSRIQDMQQCKITKFFDNHYEYTSITEDGTEVSMDFSSPDFTDIVQKLKLEAQSLRKKLETHAQRSPEFESVINQAYKHIDEFINSKLDELEHIDNIIKTFSTALKGVPNQDKAIQDDVALAIKNLQKIQSEINEFAQKDSLMIFRQYVPKFIFHNYTLDKIPNDVNVAEFTANPEGISRGMANLCRVAGLSTQKIQELANSTDVSQRETYEDHYRASLSGGINEFWTQETYNIHFRIEKEKLSVSVSDNTYSPRIAPCDRSDGFQWYLSFYSSLLNETSSEKATIILLDNPGLELHADGQRDIKKFLENKLPSDTQVIYVTHSAAMIDPFNLEQVRKIELQRDRKGTKVTKELHKTGEDADILEPVRSAIGSSLVTSLCFNQYNMLVEGAADKPILEGALSVLEPSLVEQIVVNGSVSESNYFLPKFYEQSGLPFIIVVDADSSGRAISKLLKAKGIDESKILSLKEIFTDKKGDFELEDILSRTFYAGAVKEAYPDSNIQIENDSEGKKITKMYEKEFKDQYNIGFSKKRVANKVKSLLLQEKFDDETKQNLQKIIKKTISILNIKTGKESSQG